MTATSSKPVGFFRPPRLLAGRQLAEIGDALDPKQAYYNALLAGDLASYLRAQALPTDLPAGRVVVNRLSFCHRGSSLSPGWWPTRTGTSIPRHHESNSTPQRPIHLPGYGVNAS